MLLVLMLSLFFIAAAIGCIALVAKGIFSFAKWLFASIPDIAKSGYYFGKAAAKVVVIIIAAIIAIALTCAALIALILILLILV